MFVFWKLQLADFIPISLQPLIVCTFFSQNVLSSQVVYEFEHLLMEHRLCSGLGQTQSRLIHFMTLVTFKPQVSHVLGGYIKRCHVMNGMQ